MAAYNARRLSVKSYGGDGGCGALEQRLQLPIAEAHHADGSVAAANGDERWTVGRRRSGAEPRAESVRRQLIRRNNRHLFCLNL